MIMWNDEQLAAAGIDKQRLVALVHRLGESTNEMQSMGLCLHFDSTGDACLVHASQPPFAGDGGNDYAATVAWIGPGLEGGHW
jgi:hypothetical protein